MIPYIEKLDDIKIKKIKNWSVTFKIKDDVFLLHSKTEDYESSITLYNMHVDKQGKYALEYIKNDWGDSCIGSELFPHHGKGITYSSLNVFTFVLKLCKWGFLKTDILEITKALENDNEIKLELDEIRKCISIMRKTESKLFNKLL